MDMLFTSEVSRIKYLFWADTMLGTVCVFAHTVYIMYIISCHLDLHMGDMRTELKGVTVV